MRRTRRPTRGQSLVELALVLPFLVVLIAGSAQVGAIMYGQITVDTATREAVRVASQQPKTSEAFDSSGNPRPTHAICPNATNPVCEAVSQAQGLLTLTNVEISGQAQSAVRPASCQNTDVVDGYVTVTLSYDVPVFVPFVSDLVTSGKTSQHTVTVTLTQRVEPCTMTQGS